MNAHRKWTRVVARILIGLLWIQNISQVAPSTAYAVAPTSEGSPEPAAVSPVAPLESGATVFPVAAWPGFTSNGGTGTSTGNGNGGQQGGGGQQGEATLFGPKRYTRTTGPPNKFQEVVTRPAGVTSPFTLKLRNGEANGTKRLSSVIIKANGQTIVSTSDLNQNVYTLERSVSFVGDPAKLTLDIELRSNPGSYITLSISGREEEDPHTPVIVIQQPAHQSVTTDRTPNLVVVFNDSHCGGVEKQTFKAKLDNVDRKSWFTVTNAGATATVPNTAALTDGPHTLVVEIKDRRNRISTATSVFTVDTLPPTLTIVQPVEGQFVSGETLQVRGGVTDATPVSVTVNGVPATITGTEFVATVPLGPGPNIPIVVTVVDQVGNTTERTVNVRVNGTAPTVQITSPVNGAYVKGSMIRVTGTVQAGGATASVDVNGEIATVTGNEYTAQVVAPDGPLTLTATARSGGGQPATAQVSVTVDSVAPVIAVSEPVSGLVTSAAGVRFAGTVTDPAAPTLRVAGDLIPLNVDAFEIFVPLASEGYQTVPLVAVDAAGNERRLDVPLTIDRTPPTLQIVAPVEDAVIGASPITVQGLVEDRTTVTVFVNGVEASRAQDGWQASIEIGEGPQTITVVAVDAANNRTPATREIFADLTAPVIAIASPASGLVTRASNVTVLGTVTDLSIPTVTVNGAPASVQPATENNRYDFSAPTVPLTEGDNTLRAIATDPFGRPAESVVYVTRDSTAPTVEIAAPAKISTRRAVRARITAGDNLRLDTVVVRLNDATIGSSATAPFELDLVVPENTAIGSVLTVTAEATDGAGNQAIATHTLLVVGDGVLVGQALSDVTSLPILGATATMGARAEETDARGGYSFPAADVTTRIEVSKAGMTTVVRNTPVQTGVGTPVIDARLTPLAAAQHVTPAGGALTATLPPRAGESGPASAVHVTIADGTLAGDMDLRLTPLSAQGLPGLLPSGWSPIAAFDLRADQGTASLAGATARIDRLPTRTLHLVQYRHAADAWVMIAPNLVPADAGGGNPSLDTTLPAFGAYALVAADELDPALPIPAANQPLTGVEIAPLPDTATSAGSVSPALLPATGGTAFGTLAVTSPTPLVSGIVVQTEITETFTLANGQAASEEKRLQDVVLFRTPAPDGAAAAALFPIAPSRAFAPAELVEGRVHLDVFAGRESARGMAGGNEAVTVEAGGVRLIVGAGALTEDTAVRVQAAILSSFLPIGDGVEAVAEAVVDLAGKTLTTAGELSVATTAVANSGETWVVARVERIDGVPVTVVVALADLAAGRIVTRATPGLPGITRGGRYVFYRVNVPVGFVSGIVRSQAGPTAAVVTASGLPFVAFADTDGRYMMLGREGAGIVSARVIGTSLAGEAAVTIDADEPTTKDIPLAGSVTTAVVSPADGAVRVPVTTQVEITTSVAIRTSTATSATVRLMQGTESVPARLVISGSGLSLAIVPTARLVPAAIYRVEASGVVDVFGGAIVIPATSFTTTPVEAPDYNTNRIVFGFPDGNQRVTVRAPAGSLPPGTQVLIVNQGNGVVLTLTADNDGALSGELNASISDRLLVTITDPQGGVTTFERSEFVAPDGRTAIGPGGGVVRGAGGIELRVPANAVAQGVELKLTPFDATKFPNDPMPDVANANVHFGGGIQIDAPGKPSFTKEVDLAFKKPADAPEGAFFYVYRRLQGPDGKMAYETLDQATVEGEDENAKVVTASYPFSGYTNSIGTYSLAGGVGIDSVTSSYAILMWAFEQAMPAKPTPGVVTGKVLRTKWQPGAPVPQYEPVAGALISGVDVSGQALVEFGTGASVAVSQQDGTFTMWDGRFTGGTVKLEAFVGGESRQATAYEVDPAQMLPTLRAYPKVATVVITFPAVEPPPPSPRLSVRVYRDRDGVREPTDGVVITGTPLVIGVVDDQPDANSFVVQTFEINGETRGAVPDTLQGQPTGLTYVLDSVYTPAQPGAYTVKATAQPPIGPPVTVSTTFRAIADGGGVSDPLPTEAPIVIEGRTSPKRDGQGVPLSVFPQIVFSEPVTRIPEHVTFVEVNGDVPVPFVLHGVGPSGPVSPVDNPAIAVTSLTLQPLVGLKFNTTYRLTLSDAIVDLDDGVADSKPNKPLAAYQTTFTTFGPEALGGTQETFTSAGLVVLGDRAYVTTPNVGGLGSHQLRVFDVKDPVSPVEIAEASSLYVGIPRDLVGEETSELTGGPVLATGTFLPSPPWGPSNLFLFDAAPETPRWIGAVSLGTEPLDGILTKLVLRGRRAYAATNQKGLQIVDLDIARQVFSAQTNDVVGSPGYWQMMGRLNLPGQGFGQEAIVSAISVPHVDGTSNRFTDLAVGDSLAQGNAQRLLVATGRSSLAIADADTGQLLHNGPIPWPGHEAISGWTHRVAVGRAGDRNVALVLLWAGGGTMLAVVDLGDPALPRVLTTLMLPADAFGGSGSMLFENGFAYIGGEAVTTIVNLADPFQPRVAGSLQGLGSRLAFQGENLLLGARALYSGSAPAGIQTAALGPVALIRAVTPFIVNVDGAGRTTAPIQVTYQVLNPPVNAGPARLKLLRNNEVLSEVPIASLQDGSFDVSFPENLAFEPPDDEIEIRLPRPDGTQTEPTILRLENVRELDHVVDGVPVTPLFTALSPAHVRAGATTDVKVTVTGANLTTLRDVFVRKSDGEWTSIKPESVRGTSIVMTLPRALVADAGLLQISPFARVAGSLPLMAADPSLPPPGTSSMTVDSVDTAGAVQGSLSISGTGFTDGVTVLLGRPGTTGVRVPTKFVDENKVTVEIDADALNGAGDLTVAVLSEDQTAASSSLPLQESGAGFGMMAMAAASPEDLFVSSTHGAIVWNGRDQNLQLEGYGLAPGMDVLFQKKGGGGVPMSYTATAAAAPQSPTTPITQTAKVEVKVPDPLTNFPTYCFVLEPMGAPMGVVYGPPQCIVPTMPAKVPLGGRLKFSVYQETDKKDGPIHILAQRDPAEGTKTCAVAPNTPSQQNPNNRPKLAPATWDLQRRLKQQNIRAAELTLNGNQPIPNPAVDKDPSLASKLKQIPIVERETNRCDDEYPDSFYLRGVRREKTGERLTLAAKLPASDGTMLSSNVVDVDVIYPIMGRDTAWNNANGIYNQGFEAAMVNAASAYGVPPQFLKSQAKREGSWAIQVHRYEPITIDFKTYSSQDRPTLMTTTQKIVNRHLFKAPTTGPKRSGMLSKTQTKKVPLITIHGNGTAVTFPLGSGFEILNREGAPFDDKQRIKDAVARGDAAWPVPSPPTPTPPTLTVTKAYRPELIKAYLTLHNQTRQPLKIVEPKIWRYGGKFSAKDDTGLPVHTGEVPALPALAADQFTIDYANRTITLGRAIGANDLLEVDLNEVDIDPVVSVGACVANFNPATDLKGATRAFLKDDTIASILERAITLNPGGGPVTGTLSERMIEFLARPTGPNGPPWRPQPAVVDRRFFMATGQFVAAASFGPLQLTISAYDHNGREPVLRTILDLRPPQTGADPGTNCLQDVNDPKNLQMAMDLGAARHAYTDAVTTTPACAYGVCDQQDWTARWMEVIRLYNRDDEKYKLGTDGFSPIVKDALETYFPRLVFY